MDDARADLRPAAADQPADARRGRQPWVAAVSALVTLALGAAFTAAAVRLFGREAALFGKGA